MNTRTGGAVSIIAQYDMWQLVQKWFDPCLLGIGAYIRRQIQKLYLTDQSCKAKQCIKSCHLLGSYFLLRKPNNAIHDMQSYIAYIGGLEEDMLLFV